MDHSTRRTLETGLRDLEEGLSRVVSGSFSAGSTRTSGDPITTPSFSDFRPVRMVSLNIQRSNDVAVLNVSWCDLRGDSATFSSEQWKQVAPGIFVVTSQSG